MSKQINFLNERGDILKKVYILGIIFFFIPLTNVFAEQIDLLNGQAPAPYQAITDGDKTTGYSNGAGQTDYSFEIPFNKAVSRDSVISYESTYSHISLTSTFELLDENDDVISIHQLDRNSVITVPSTLTTVITKVRLNIKDNTLTTSFDSFKDFRIYYDTELNSNKPLELLPVENLMETHTSNSVNLNWKNPTSTFLKSIVIKKDGIEIAVLPKNVSSYTVNSLLPETNYIFEVIAKYSDDSVSDSKFVSFTTDIKLEDNTPPVEITNLSVVKTHDSANFVFTNPVDTDFSHIEVYRDGHLINDQLKETIFNDVGLVPNTSYVYRFVSVDLDGNKSAGFIQTVLTDSETDSAAPAPPININAIQGNGSGRIVWKSNEETDLQGYNLYINGTKYNSNLILANNYVLSALNNGEKYSITVTAVDTSGNESLHSNVVILNPSESAMPLIESKFDLKAVADGTNNWFMSLWPILAFSVGITLAFLIARRVKTLFFA